MPNSFCVPDSAEDINNESDEPETQGSLGKGKDERDKLMKGLISSFDEAIQLVRDGKRQKYVAPECTLVLEILREDYDKIESEYLPKVEEQIVSLKNALEYQKLIDFSTDDPNWHSISIIPKLVSTYITKAIIGLNPVDENSGLEKPEASENAKCILIPVTKYSFIIYMIHNIAMNWEFLIWTYKRYLQTLLGIPERGLSSRFWPEIITYSNFVMESVESSRCEIAESSNQHFHKMFEVTANTFEDRIENYRTSFFKICDQNLLSDDEEEEIDDERWKLTLKSWIGVLLLLRLLVRKLSCRDHHSLGIFSRLSYAQLVALDDEFNRWIEGYESGMEEFWYYGEDHQKKAEEMSKSLKTMGDILLLEKTVIPGIEPEDIDKKEERLTVGMIIDKMSSKINELFDEAPIDKNDDEKLWIKTWFVQINLAVQNILPRILFAGIS